MIISSHVIFDTFNTYAQCPYDVIPVLDTGMALLHRTLCGSNLR
ncbi:hypothetical protein [Wolbachia endosymbiont (group A) of Agelastica alni]